MRFLLLTSLGLTLGSALVAQSVPHPTTIPKVATGTFLGGASSFPLGRTGGKAQYWFRGDSINAPSLVNAIGPRPSRNYTGAARTQSLEVTMANSTLAYAAFTNVFAQNLGTQPTIVYARKVLSIPAVTAHQDPDLPGVWIVLDAPFVLSGPNLILDYDLGTAASAAGASYNGDLVTLASPGRHFTSDPSCGGTLTATSTASTFTLSLGGATPLAPTWLMLSLNPTSFSGLALPFRLDAIGMTNCVLGVDPQVVIGSMADASGASTLAVPLALPADAYVIYAQTAHVSAATPLGLATTNVTRSILGFTGFCSYIYNFTVDGPTAQNGPFTWQGAMLLRP